MMQQDNTRAMDVLRVGAFLIPALIALVLLIVGGLNIDRPWGVAVLCIGFFGMFAVGIGKWQESSALSIYGSFLIISLGLMWIGAMIDESVWNKIFLVGGTAGVMFAGICATFSLQLNRLLGDEGGMVDVQVIQLKSIHDLLEKIHDTSLITESTKRVLYRDLELTLLRRKIDDLIGRGDYDAGLDLCETIEKAFDSSDEADMFRHRILRSRQEHHEAEIHGAMEHFDHLLQKRDWAHAHQEAARIRRLFPDSDLIGELDNRIHAARSEHKQELLSQFRTSMDHDNIESAMKLLRELDRYLTREEATQLSLQAQTVVERHRDNLSTRFKIAVNDRRWTEAIQIGDLIRHEFPNTKIAEEVDSMIDVLQTRATEAATPASPAQN